MYRMSCSVMLLIWSAKIFIRDVWWSSWSTVNIFSNFLPSAGRIKQYNNDSEKNTTHVRKKLWESMFMVFCFLGPALLSRGLNALLIYSLTAKLKGSLWCHQIQRKLQSLSDVHVVCCSLFPLGICAWIVKTNNNSNNKNNSIHSSTYEKIKT